MSQARQKSPLYLKHVRMKEKDIFEASVEKGAPA